MLSLTEAVLHESAELTLLRKSVSCAGSS